MTPDQRRRLRAMLADFKRRVESLAEGANAPELLDCVARALERALESRIKRIL